MQQQLQTNSIANNENTNNNTVNDSNKLLIPTSTITTKTNNNKKCANKNNSENNNSSNLIPSSIDEERNESEKCDNARAAKQDVKNSGFKFISIEERNYVYCWRFDVSSIERKNSQNSSDVKELKSAIALVEKQKIYNSLF